jgi:hypothetical protein
MAAADPVGASVCSVCGTRFDGLRYQVVVPGLSEPRAFDTVECADVALADSEHRRRTRRRRDPRWRARGPRYPLAETSR